jgi:hypothetical protein
MQEMDDGTELGMRRRKENNQRQWRQMTLKQCSIGLLYFNGKNGGIKMKKIPTNFVLNK